MVFSSPVSSLSNFIKTRPPLIVFTTCILFLAIFTSSLVFCIQRGYKMRNYNAKEDWISLLSYLSTEEVCFKQIEKPLALSSDKKDDTKHTSINVPAKLIMSSLNATNMNGVLYTGGWASKCSFVTDVPDALKISVYVRNIEKAESHDVCVMFTGPVGFIPKFEGTSSCNVTKSEERSIEIISQDATSEKGDFCHDLPAGKIVYNVTEFEHRNIDVYLSSSDMSTIQGRLIKLSYFLAMVFLLILVYGVWKGVGVDRSRFYSGRIQFS